MIDFLASPEYAVIAHNNATQTLMSIGTVEATHTRNRHGSNFSHKGATFAAEALNADVRDDCRCRYRREGKKKLQ